MRLCMRGTRYIVTSVVLLQLNLGLCDHEIVASFGEEERPQANMAILTELEVTQQQPGMTLNLLNGQPRVALDPTMNPVSEKLLGTLKTAGWS